MKYVNVTGNIDCWKYYKDKIKQLNRFQSEWKSETRKRNEELWKWM